MKPVFFCTFLFCFFVVALSVSSGVDFVWEGHAWTNWYGYTSSVTGWGQSMQHPSYLGGDDGFYNGWGYVWYGGESCAHFPGASDFVTIPMGFAVLSHGSCSMFCGNLLVESGAFLNLEIQRLSIYGPTLTHDGVVTASNYAGNRGGLNLYGDLEITGTNPMAFNDGVIVSQGAVRQLTIASAQTLSGVSLLGGNAGSEKPVNVVNNGTIVGEAMVYACELYGGVNCVNNHELRAAEASGSYHGQINLRGHWNNTNGALVAEDGGVIELWAYDSDGDSYNDGSLTGGVLETEGTGVIRVRNAEFIVSDITNNGCLQFPNFSQGGVSGTLTNHGKLLIGQESYSVGAGDMILHEDTLLTGTGESILGYSGHILSNVSSVGDETLTIDAGHILFMRDGSHLGGENGRQIQVVNNGVIDFDPSLTDNNKGQIRVTGDGITNNGTFIIREGQTASNGEQVEYYGPFNQTTMGDLIIDGWLYCVDHFQVGAGVVTGGGHVNMNGYTFTLAAGAIWDMGRDVNAVRFNNATLGLADGAILQWRPGNGVINQGYADNVVLPSGGTIHLVVTPQGAATVAGDYVLIVSSNVSGNPTWDITLPAGWTCDGVAYENNDVVIKNLNGTLIRFDLMDFSELAASWLLSSGEAGYNDAFDFVDNDAIDLDDLAYMSQYWLNQ